jgi:AcrR family transcriptional regulator
MSSNKSRPSAGRIALKPQRRHGKLRVEALLQSAASVIAERGFDATTMAEIASRAGAPIGSLYRFFPHKEALAEALLDRYAELVKEAFERINREIKTLSSAALTDALLHLFIELRGETQAIIPLLDAHSPQRVEFRKAVRQRIARILRARLPRLRPAVAESIAVVLVHNMKTMKMLSTEKNESNPQGAMQELREMTRLYLASKLGD